MVYINFICHICDISLYISNFFVICMHTICSAAGKDMQVLLMMS